MRRALAVSIILGSLTSCVKLIQHDPKAAAEAATAFAWAAVLERDAAKASAFMTPSFAREYSPEKLSERIAAMHPATFPIQIAAKEYEPMPGQRAMMLYLQGVNDEEDFHYRLIMEGDASAGYRVSGLFRGSGPYPPSRRQPLR